MTKKNLHRKALQKVGVKFKEMYKIIFSDKDKMGDFIEEHIPSNYSSNNFLSTVEIDEKNYPKESTLKLATQFGGRLVEI